MSKCSTITDNAAAVLEYLGIYGYDETAKHFETSRGTVYRLAVAHQKRKYEALIRERKEDRIRRQTEFLQEVIDSAQTCDVLDFLDGIPDNSVALHMTSIPYNIGKKYGDSCFIDARPFYYYLGFVLQVLSELVRTLTPNGVIFLQLGNTKDIDGQPYPLDCLVFDYLRGMKLLFQNRVIWSFSHGLTPKHRLSQRYETALVMSKSEKYTFHPNAARVPQKNPAKRAFKGPNAGKLSGHPLGAFPSDCWQIPHVGNNHPDAACGRHPAQFPLQLAKRSVLIYSNPGDIVCDCFVGSGTSFIAAKETHRHFVGADLFYDDLRRKRLQKVVPDIYCRFTGVTEESMAVWQAEAVSVEHKPARLITPQENEQLILRFNEEVFGKAA